MYEVKPLILIYARHTPEGVWNGMIQECCEPEPREFFSKTELIRRIDQYAAQRHCVTDLGDYYKPGGVWVGEVIPKHKRGGLSFWVEIMACQRGTWQGRVIYKGTPRFFKDESELFALMGDAYTAKANNTASR